MFLLNLSEGNNFGSETDQKENVANKQKIVSYVQRKEKKKIRLNKKGFVETERIKLGGNVSMRRLKKLVVKTELIHREKRETR